MMQELAVANFLNRRLGHFVLGFSQDASSYVQAAALGCGRLPALQSAHTAATGARPQLVAVAGPNGAGKSTVGARLLKETLGIGQFVNADDIARGLAGFAPETAAFEAGRIMLRWMGELARRRETFAFETTFAGRTYARFVAAQVAAGYSFHLIFLWLEGPDLALKRVADRARHGGHSIPDAVIRRRYDRGMSNLRELYLPLAETWKIYDNSLAGPPRPVAAGRGVEATDVFDADTWQRMAGSSAP